VDGALAAMATSGDLRAVLARWRLDGPRQDAVGAKAATGAGYVAPAAGASPPAARARLDMQQALLFIEGAGVTLLVSCGAMIIAMLGGALLALARLPSPLPWRRSLAWLATAYVEVFRGTPVLLQLYVIYYALAPVLALDALPAAIVGLGLNYAAYEAEIYRGGIQAVPRGEVEAGLALGMSGALTLRRIVMPQAMRFSLPGMANDFISLLKDSSLVSVITVVELTKRTTIAAVDLGDWVLPGLLCGALYFAMSYPMSRLARRLEARLSGGVKR
jgi:polar amino acid transport system substrate-binding protein